MFADDNFEKFKSHMEQIGASYPVALKMVGDDLYYFEQIPTVLLDKLFNEISEATKVFRRKCIIGRTECSITIRDYTLMTLKKNNEVVWYQIKN